MGPAENPHAEEHERIQEEMEWDDPDRIRCLDDSRPGEADHRFGASCPRCDGLFQHGRDCGPLFNHVEDAEEVRPGEEHPPYREQAEHLPFGPGRLRENEKTEEYERDDEVKVPRCEKRLPSPKHLVE